VLSNSNLSTLIVERKVAEVVSGIKGADFPALTNNPSPGIRCRGAVSPSQWKTVPMLAGRAPRCTI